MSFESNLGCTLQFTYGNAYNSSKNCTFIYLVAISINNRTISCDSIVFPHIACFSFLSGLRSASLSRQYNTAQHTSMFAKNSILSFLFTRNNTCNSPKLFVALISALLKFRALETVCAFNSLYSKLNNKTIM